MEMIQTNTDNFMKIFLDTLLLILFFASGALGLDVPSKVVLIALLGSLSGSIVLAYFRREKLSEMVFKVMCSSIAGLFLGVGSQEYFQIEKITLIGLNYFLSSLLSLFILKALVSFTESSALKIIKTIFQKVVSNILSSFGYKEEKERRKRS